MVPCFIVRRGIHIRLPINVQSHSIKHETRPGWDCKLDLKMSGEKIDYWTKDSRVVPSRPKADFIYKYL
jgi:hypothetical protein